MSETVFLIDLDGVLLDKPRDWQKIKQTFSRYYPERNPHEVQEFYIQHRGEQHSADAAIEAGLSVYGPDFWRVFYETDHRQALQPDWRDLHSFCQKQGIDMAICTEGSVGKRPWTPEGYQPFKVKQLNLPMPAMIYADKVSQLPQVVSDFHQQGAERIVLLDDSTRVLQVAASLGIMTYLMEGVSQPESWLDGVVPSLSAMAACFPLSD